MFSLLFQKVSGSGSTSGTFCFEGGLREARRKVHRQVFRDRIFPIFHLSLRFVTHLPVEERPFWNEESNGIVTSVHLIIVLRKFGFNPPKIRQTCTSTCLVHSIDFCLLTTIPFSWSIVLLLQPVPFS